VLIPDDGGGGISEIYQFDMDMGVVEQQHNMVPVEDLELVGNVNLCARGDEA
jgi:hypothetical protein